MGFDTGPLVEPCGACEGTGRTYSRADKHGIFAAMIREKGTFLDPDARLLLVALASLEERLERVEADVRRSHVRGEASDGLWRP